MQNQGKDPVQAYEESLYDIAKNSRIMFLNESRVPIFIPIRTDSSEYYLCAFIRSRLYEDYKRYKSAKKLPSQIQWIYFLERQKEIFSKASKIGKKVGAMLRGAYRSLEGKIM